MSKQRSKLIFLLLLFLALQMNLPAQEVVPPSMVFYNIWENMFHSVIFNYSVNFLAATAGSLGLMETNLEQYNRPEVTNQLMTVMGFPSLYLGYVMPVFMPVSIYLIGRSKMDEKIQITGTALLQSFLLTLGFTGVFNGLTDVFDPIPDEKLRDAAAGNLGRGQAHWPSLHTAQAFAAATTIAEIYNDALLVQVAAYAYAAYITLGVSISSHWSSEIFIGALVGFAVGKTVGISFNRFLRGKENNNVFFSVMPGDKGITISVRIEII
jgi:membrane-associated phospholipid phosphatase